MSLTCDNERPMDLDARSTTPTETELAASPGERKASREVTRYASNSMWRRFSLERWDLWCAVLLGATALFARLPLILRGEAFLHSDEAIVGIMAQDIADFRQFPSYFYGQRYMGALEAYTIALLRPLFTDPLLSLRMGPALYFGILVGLQFLLLKRWFGREPAAWGAVALICASPMFAWWSIAARGGYIEIFCVGTLLWWMYSEWFVDRAEVVARHKAFFGFTVGFGFWLNPMIVAILAPVALHALFQFLDQSCGTSRWGQVWKSYRTESFWKFPVPVLTVVAAVVFLANVVLTVETTSRGVEYRSLFGLLPPAWALPALFLAVSASAVLWNRKYPFFAAIQRQVAPNAPFIFGVIAGLSPAFFYVGQRLWLGLPLEDAVPLGLRPIFRVGETLQYAIHGAPILFGSSPVSFIRLLLPASPLGKSDGHSLLQLITQAGGFTVAAGFLMLGAVLVMNYERELKSLVQLQWRCYSPLAFLFMAFAAFLMAYLLSGAVVDFSSVRYLLLLWLLVPGLIASGIATPNHRSVSIVAFSLFFCWTLGQIDLTTRGGSPHPLQSITRQLQQHGVTEAVAEFQEAQYISFLSQQRVRVAEFQSFWPRLAHYQVGPEANDSFTNYVVRKPERVPPNDWTFPGPAPPELRRTLEIRLARYLRQNPQKLISRNSLGDDFDLVVLSSPLPAE